MSNIERNCRKLLIIDFAYFCVFAFYIAFLAGGSYSLIGITTLYGVVLQLGYCLVLLYSAMFTARQMHSTIKLLDHTRSCEVCSKE